MVSDQKCYLEHLKHIENKFDYLMFLAEAFSKQVSYDLNDLYYEDRFSRINKDLDTLEVLQKKLTNPDVFSREPQFGEQIGKGIKVESALKPSIKIRDSQKFEVRFSDLPRESVNESVADKWRSVNDSKVEAYYDTWQKTDWKAKDPTINPPERSLKGSVKEQKEGNVQSKDYYLAITVISAEHLVLSTISEAPNAMFRASFSLYSSDMKREIAKQYTSDVVPRQSNPEWNFQMNFQFTNLEAFMEANHDKEICIELIHLKPIPYSSHSLTEEHLITSMIVRLFENFTREDILKLTYNEIMEIRKDLEVQTEDGVKLLLKVEILTNGESLENPFKEEMINNIEIDKERGKINYTIDSLWKTKQTLEELRHLENLDLEDRNILSDQKALENLKNTLSSSEIYRGVGHSLGITESKKDNFPRIDARPNSYTPSHDIYRSDVGPISEPGKQINIKQLDKAQKSHPEELEYSQEEYSQPNYEADAAGKGLSNIHFEDHTNQGQDSRKHLPNKEGVDLSNPQRDREHMINSSTGEDQMRPTPDFVPQLGMLKDDSQEGASSYNPFRQNLLNREPDNRTEEQSADSNLTKPKTKKEGDSLIKGLKSKIPGGKLRDEDLERIERIFRNRKFDAKAFDLEDSDMDYF